MTLSGASTPGQSGPVSNGKNVVHHIPQISYDRAIQSDGLMLYPGN